MPNQYTQLSSLATSKSFGTASGSDVVVPEDAVSALLQAETQNIRFRHDGGIPTASVGLRLIAGDAPIRIDGKDAIRNLKVIEETASAKLNIGLVVT